MQHLALIGSLQEKLLALQGGRTDGPFVTAENIANATQKVTETLGFKTSGLFFQPPERVAAAMSAPPHPTQPAPDPAVAAAIAQIEIDKQAAAADAAIKRLKAEAEIEIARWKAEQWAEVEKFKAGVESHVGALAGSTSLRFMRAWRLREAESAPYIRCSGAVSRASRPASATVHAATDLAAARLTNIVGFRRRPCHGFLPCC